jgi:hypothetical protein
MGPSPNEENPINMSFLLKISLFSHLERGFLEPYLNAVDYRIII